MSAFYRNRKAVAVGIYGGEGVFSFRGYDCQLMYVSCASDISVVDMPVDCTFRNAVGEVENYALAVSVKLSWDVYDASRFRIDEFHRYISVVCDTSFPVGWQRPVFRVMLAIIPLHRRR